MIPNKPLSLEQSPFVTSGIVGHVTIGLLTCGFLLVVNSNQPPLSHCFWDIKLQRYWGHDLDILGSRDVIDHVTTELVIRGFVLVVNFNQPSVSHGFWDVELQAYVATLYFIPSFIILRNNTAGLSPHSTAGYE